MKKTICLTMICCWLAPALILAAGTKQAKGPIVNYPAMGLHDPPVTALPVPPPYTLLSSDNVDLVGDTMTIGTTWYESQHNGTIGRMIALDELGYLHFTWMNGLTSNPAGSRHVYYNFVYRGEPGWVDGYAVESSDRGGYTVVDAGFGGIAFPAFHWDSSPTSTNAYSAVASDYFAHAGAFQVWELPHYLGQDLQFIWPRMCMKQDGEMLVLSTEYMAAAGDSMRQTWSLGTYNQATNTITYTDQEFIELTMTIAAEVAASRVSNRVAAAWTYSRDFGVSDATQYNNDIHMMIDDDGQDLNFDNWFNLTNFIYPDSLLLPDTLRADGDTLRAYTDINLFFDDNDVCHAAFTTPGYYEFEGLISVAPAIIWHWSEADPNTFTIIANHWYANYACGAWNRNVQRPSLGQDPNTGYLYCMYQVYDSSSVSAGGFVSGEVYISVSTDGGLSWSEGKNVTNTISPDGAAAGQCLSELSPSMGEIVDGACDIMYVLDRDAGFVVQTEGVATLNNVIYHRVPVDSIPTAPLVPQDVPFHVEHLPDTTRLDLGEYFAPHHFALQQNTPNPFNPTTTIRFSLASQSQVHLAVYNLEGERVAVVLDGILPAGDHAIDFDGRKLASGVYLYRLEAAGRSISKKMLLIK